LNGERSLLLTTPDNKLWRRCDYETPSLAYLLSYLLTHLLTYLPTAFIALTLSVGRQEDHPGCEILAEMCRCGYLSAVGSK